MPIETTDPGAVRVVGDNPVLYLFDEGSDGPPSTSVNLWRASYSPAGPGNVLFLHGELTGGEPVAYADNPALVDLLIEEILRVGQPYKVPGLPVTRAGFTHIDRMPWHVTTVVEASADRVEVSWSGFETPFAGHVAPDPAPGPTYGHYAVYVSARRGEVARNGRRATGSPRPLVRDGRALSSAFVALAESWQRYDGPGDA